MRSEVTKTNACRIIAKRAVDKLNIESQAVRK